MVMVLREEEEEYTKWMCGGSGGKVACDNSGVE